MNKATSEICVFLFRSLLSAGETCMDQGGVLPVITFSSILSNIQLLLSNTQRYHNMSQYYIPLQCTGNVSMFMLTDANRC